MFAGLRPLVAAEGGTDTTRLSREHRLFSPLPGLTAIAGGKYTTYRVMARDAVDAAAADLGSTAPSTTDRVPLVGAVEAAHEEDPLRLRHGGCADEVLDPRRGQRRACRPAGRRRRVHRRRGGARRHASGRARPRRHPFPAHPGLDRDGRPRPRRGGGDRAPRRARAGVVRRAHGRGARPLREAARRRSGGGGCAGRRSGRGRPIARSWRPRPGRPGRRRAAAGDLRRIARVGDRRRRSAACGR